MTHLRFSLDPGFEDSQSWFSSRRRALCQRILAPEPQTYSPESTRTEQSRGKCAGRLPCLPTVSAVSLIPWGDAGHSEDPQAGFHQGGRLLSDLVLGPCKRDTIGASVLGAASGLPESEWVCKDLRGTDFFDEDENYTKIQSESCYSLYIVLWENSTSSNFSQKI